MVRDDHAVGFGDRGNEAAIQVAPCRLTVQHDHWPPAAFVDVVLTETRRGHEAWCEWPGAVEVLVFWNHGWLAPV